MSVGPTGSHTPHPAFSCGTEFPQHGAMNLNSSPLFKLWQFCEWCNDLEVAVPCV